MKKSLTQLLFELPAIGPAYDLASFPFLVSTIMELDRMLEKRAFRGTVLDIGAGTGTISKHLKERGFEVIGVEPSAQMRWWAEFKGIKEIGDGIENLPVKGQFDMVIASYLLRHIPPEETERVMTIMTSRASRYLIINDLNLPIIGPPIGKKQILGVWTLYDPKGLAELITGKGFNLIEVAYPLLSVMLVFERRVR